MSREIFTVGHSTRSFPDFVRILRRHEIAAVADVRTAPRSRRLPHFSKEVLGPALDEEGVDYVHLKELGGWRRPVPGSLNTGWRSKAFQGYADHMSTPEFEQALERLELMAAKRRFAVMCAESLWWRCHRMLLSDALTVRGWTVLHIGARAAPEQHRLTEFAVVDSLRLTYPARQASLDV